MKLNKDTLKIEEIYVNKLNLTHYDNTEHPLQVMNIRWSCNLGFGEYTFYFDEDGTISADSEYMDKGDDKEFLKALMEKFIEKVQV